MPNNYLDKVDLNGTTYDIKDTVSGYTTNTGTVTSVGISGTSPINASGTVTSSGTLNVSHATSGVTAGTYRNVTVNATGHVTAGSNDSDLFQVTMTWNSNDGCYYADKTNAQVTAAYNTGRIPYVVCGGGEMDDCVCQLVEVYQVESTWADFTFASLRRSTTSESDQVYYIKLPDDDVVEYWETDLSQNVFTDIKIGNVSVSPDNKSDTLELVAGTGISLTPDATNDKITISSTVSGDVTDVKVDNASVVTNKVANVVTSTSHPYNASTNPLATIGDISAMGGGTVTSVGITGTSPISASGTVTSTGTLSVSHEASGVTAQATQALYPFTVNSTGHVTSVGSAVTIPTVNNGALKLQKNSGTASSIYTANQSGDTTLKYTTTSVGSASNWNAGSATTLGTAIPADDITAWTTNTPTAIDTSKFNGGSFTRGTFTQGSFTQGTDSFTPNTPTVVDTSKFNGGSFTRGSFSGGSFTQGTDSFTAATMVGSVNNYDATAANPATLTISFSGGNFTQGSDSFTAATHAADSFTPASLSSGFYTAGTAASFTQGTDTYVKPTHANDSFTPASLASGFYTAGSAASLSYTPKSIPNVTSAGTAPSLTVTSTTVVNDISSS